MLISHKTPVKTAFIFNLQLCVQSVFGTSIALCPDRGDANLFSPLPSSRYCRALSWGRWTVTLSRVSSFSAAWRMTGHSGQHQPAVSVVNLSHRMTGEGRLGTAATWNDS